MKILGQIQTKQDITSKEYMDLYSGKIDVIKVDGVAQDIEEKVVNIDLSGKADADQLPLKVDKYSTTSVEDSRFPLEGYIDNTDGQPHMASHLGIHGFEFRVTPNGLQQIEYKPLQEESGVNEQTTNNTPLITHTSLLVTEDDLTYVSDELKNYINDIEIISVEPEDDSYIAAYSLVNAEGTRLGSTINIPKDFLVKDAVLCICEEDNIPEVGFKTGDKYIDFIINVAGTNSTTSKHIYLNVQDLVDTYIPGDMISIENNKISARVTDGNGLSIANNSLAMNLASESASGAMSSIAYTKLLGIESNAQVNKIETVDSADFIVENRVLKVKDGKALFTQAQANKLNAIADNATKVESTTLNGAIKINGIDKTVYTHPAVTPEEAKACKVGKDGNGHVVLGSALKLADLADDAQHRVVTDVEKMAWNAKADNADIPTSLSDLTPDNEHAFITQNEVNSIGNKESKGMLTIDGVTYQLRTSSVDAGAAGYITFVLEN